VPRHNCGPAPRQPPPLHAQTAVQVRTQPALGAAAGHPSVAVPVSTGNPLGTQDHLPRLRGGLSGGTRLRERRLRTPPQGRGRCRMRRAVPGASLPCGHRTVERLPSGGTSAARQSTTDSGAASSPGDGRLATRRADAGPAAPNAVALRAWCPETAWMMLDAQFVPNPTGEHSGADRRLIEILARFDDDRRGCAAPAFQVSDDRSVYGCARFQHKRTAVHLVNDCVSDGFFQCQSPTFNALGQTALREYGYPPLFIPKSELGGRASPRRRRHVQAVATTPGSSSTSSTYQRIARSRLICASSFQVYHTQSGERDVIRPGLSAFGLVYKT